MAERRSIDAEREQVLRDSTLTPEERASKLKELDHIAFMRRKYEQLFAQEVLLTSEVGDVV